MDKNKYLIKFVDREDRFLASLYFCNYQSPHSNHIKAIISCIGNAKPVQKEIVESLLSVLPKDAGILVDAKWYKKYPKSLDKTMATAEDNNWRLGSDEGKGLLVISPPVNKVIERTNNLEVVTYKILYDIGAPVFVESHRIYNPD